jgi:2-methylcitrate dehydratase PrpD
MAIVTQGVLPASILVTGKQPAWLKQWSRFARTTRFGDLPEAAVERARLVMLDSIGAIIAGSAEPEMQAAMKRLGKTAKARRAGSPLLTAFAGGTAGTMLEIDEGNQYARGHPGIHVVPAVMAVAENRRVSGEEAILALVLGYEIGARIGIASKLRVTMHPHGTWGVVGAALAVAKLHRGSAREIGSSINVASSFGLTTSRRTMLEGATVRNTYAGFSNMLGLMAWDLVKAGFTGEADGVGSVYGGIAADNWMPGEMTRELEASRRLPLQPRCA